MTRSKIAGLALLAVGSLMSCALPLAAQENNTVIQHATRFAISPPLSELAKMPQKPVYGLHLAEPVRRIPKRPVGSGAVDTVEQSSAAPSAAYTVGANFLGVGHGFPGYSVPDAPPDTTMAVGDTEVVQWVNTSYTVCQKTSPYTCGPAIEGNTLWTSLGGICAANNDGDIIAQWDLAAHRWLLTQNVFTGTYGVCVAISTTNDANGTYFLYEFPVVAGGFPDYPKWGVWSNNYAEAWNNFGVGGSGFVGPVLCAYNRTKLLAGDHTAEQICHQYTSHEDSLLPADRDSIIAPPANEDQFAIGSVGDVDNSHLSLYSVHINNINDWTQGATFTGDNNSQLLAVATYNPACNGNYGGDCVPQQGITDLLDSLGDRLMYRFAYWSDQASANATATPPMPAPAQHWFVNFDVPPPLVRTAYVGWKSLAACATRRLPTLPSSSRAPMLLMESGAGWDPCPRQSRRHPGWLQQVLRQHLSRWRPNLPVHRDRWPSGQRPLGLGMLEAEVPVVAGSGSQPDTSSRWGDYSSMRIDTNDGMNGCTFWYTQEYYMVTQTFDWSTQVASAKFSNCN